MLHDPVVIQWDAYPFSNPVMRAERDVIADLSSSDTYWSALILGVGQRPFVLGPSWQVTEASLSVLAFALLVTIACSLRGICEHRERPGQRSLALRAKRNGR